MFMKSKKNLLKELEILPYFKKSTIIQLAKQIGLADASVATYVSRYLKNKEIISLKKGLYVSADFFEKNKRDVSYSLYLANILRSPSYVSSWTALQYYGLATEAIHTITSVTPKLTRTYATGVGTFSFQSIHKELFSDFSLVPGKFDFFIARPAKALFDLLYYKTGQFRATKIKDIETIVDDSRIDLDEMESSEKERFFTLIKKYCHE